MFQIDMWCFNPEAFQVIKFSKRLVKYVDYHIPIIHKHPMAFLFPFNAINPETSLAHFSLQVARDGLNLPCGASGGNEKVIGY